MSKDVTMRDIAQAMGLSAVSVSKALSGKEGVSDVVRADIIRKAQEMGYIYVGRGSDASERSVPLIPSVQKIGVLVAERYLSGDSYYASLYAMLSMECTSNGLLSVLEILPASAEDNGQLPAFLNDSSTAAFIILGQLSSKYIATLHSATVPYIFLDFYDEVGIGDAIVCDSMYGSYLLTTHLIRMGHKDIGFVGNMKATTSIMDRYLGYHCAIVRNGLITRAECIVMDRDISASSVIFDTFKLPERLPTAFVCNCDDTALRLVRQLTRMGVKVCDDISVVGYDNHITATICDPPLTTFSVDKLALITAAIEAIKEKIANPSMHVLRKIVGGEVIYRDSVKKLCY